MKGILFAPDNHKAIRDNRKTQTRRVIPYQFTLPPEAGKPYLSGDGFLSVIPDIKNFKGWAFITDNKGRKIKPRYRVGETVYIKEAYYPCLDENQKPRGDVIYKDDEDAHLVQKGEWKSPLFMPAWAARTFIKITDVRPERLWDITLRDIESEGIWTYEDPWKAKGLSITQCRMRFARLWNSINGKTYPWDLNPWCWRNCFNPEELK